MSALLILIPIALLLGGAGLAAFLWALRNGQFDDLDGAAMRILIDRDPDRRLDGGSLSDHRPVAMPGGMAEQGKDDDQPEEQRRDPDGR